MDDVLQFEAAIGQVGLSLAGLKVEAIRTDGTSNYLVNLNYRGQTWAAALRIPAKGASLEQFLREKRQALEAVKYLSNLFWDGVDVGSNCSLKFQGLSHFVSGPSAQSFMRTQAAGKAFRIVDSILGRRKTIEGINYPDNLGEDVRGYMASYQDPFYVSRGAPAWETLEEYIDLERPVACALAALQLRTGRGLPIPQVISERILHSVAQELWAAADAWEPIENSKEERALVKSIKKWRADGDADRLRLVRRERFLRTDAGKSVYSKALQVALGLHQLPSIPLQSFCHGDAHGGNFILVKYEYKINTSDDVLLDRVFLNDVFAADQSVDQVSIRFDDKELTVYYELPVGASGAILSAERKLHHEIHLIDLDSGCGTTDETKVIHLYDALVYCLSLSNLTALSSSVKMPTEVLRDYYEWFY